MQKISLIEQMKIINKGADEIIELSELQEKLVKSIESNTPLTVKLGFDPTAPDIHLGHTVVLRKARQLQDLGHRVIIIIGDFTGMIGDPTGNSKTRKQLTHEEVMQNAETYKTQVFKILDAEKTTLRFNSEWLSRLDFKNIIGLCSKFTVSRMLEREDFKKRFSKEQPLGIHEFFYPIMQAYDSVYINADIELGGTDQRFNILTGRFLQKEFNKPKQVAIFMPLLEGTDGTNKMSKSLMNYIGIDESPESIYVKTMSIPDDLILKYYELVTDIHPDDLQKIKDQLGKDEINPRDIKMVLAKELVRLYHNEALSQKAEDYFKTLFQKKEIPSDIECIQISDNELEGSNIHILRLITLSHFTSSSSEAKRLVLQGGVKINGNRIDDVGNVSIKDNDVLQCGKQKIGRIKIMI